MLVLIWLQKEDQDALTKLVEQGGQELAKKVRIWKVMFFSLICSSTFP